MAISIGPVAARRCANLASYEDLVTVREARIFSPAVLHRVLRELGGSRGAGEAASKQGGGSTHWTWPNGMRLDDGYLSTLDGLTQSLFDWGVPVHTTVNPSMRPPCSAVVNGHHASAYTLTGAIILACLWAGLRPNQVVPVFLDEATGDRLAKEDTLDKLDRLAAGQ